MKQIRLVLLFTVFSLYTSAQKGMVAAKVDPRIELMSILARLAGLGGYDSKAFKLYADDVHAYFAKDSLHPAVLHLKELRTRTYLGFDAIARMAIHLDYPSLKPKVAFSSSVPEARWTKEGAEKFIPLLQQFYKDTRFDSFFNAHRSMYADAEKRFQVLLDKADYDWFPHFYGYRPEGPFSVFLGLLNGNFSYGPKVEYPGGKEEFYAVMATYKTDSTGMPVYDQSMLSTVVHEFNHSFINHLVLNDSVAWKPYASKIHDQVGYQMQKLYYPQWKISLFESLVRAAVIRYEMEHDTTGGRIAASVAEETRLGFYWMEDLVTLMGVYEKSRKAYPNFVSFVPVLKAYLKDLSENMEFKYKSYAERLPRFVTSLPFSNGASDVDPAIKEITLIFSKPMRGWSVSPTGLGKEHYPLESVLGWDESFTQLRLKLSLKPNWNYEILLREEGFRTREGYSLIPVVFSFTTK
ncbi:MAG TPA: DUF4932 domain-containing protein [Flavisolibacter sp.]|nr:DUF4932 domain-containing protein [Flavisolibacter sp.]